MILKASSDFIRLHSAEIKLSLSRINRLLDIHAISIQCQALFSLIWLTWHIIKCSLQYV